jgi:hypothetical protein
MSGHIENVIDSSCDPVIAVVVTPGAISGKIVAWVS